MSLLDTLRAARLAVRSAAQDTDALTTADEVRAEISDAMDAIAAHSEQERDLVLAEEWEALDRLDGEIKRREQALRDNYAEMSETARDRRGAVARSAARALPAGRALRRARSRGEQRLGRADDGLLRCVGATFPRSGA